MEKQRNPDEESADLEAKIQNLGFERVTEDEFYNIISSMGHGVLLNKKKRTTGFVTGSGHNKTITFVVYAYWPISSTSSNSELCIFINKNYKESCIKKSLDYFYKLVYNLYKYHKTLNIN